MKAKFVAILLSIALFSFGCATTGKYQEPDDVYVTEADRASEKAEAMAQAEQMRTNGSGPAPTEGTEVEDNDRTGQQSPNQNRRNRNSAANRIGNAILYVLAGILEIALNVVLLFLLY